jgi:hypothetical protein
MVKDVTNEFRKKRKRSKQDKKRLWKKKIHILAATLLERS